MPSRRDLLQGSFAALAALALPGDVRAGDGGAEAAHPNMLWYEQPAREWTEALPVGNGRIGAMVFGGIAKERLQLNEDTLWAGGPYDPVNPEASGALAEVRRLIFADRWAEAEALANARLMARPIAQMPYQTVGDLLTTFQARRTFPTTAARSISTRRLPRHAFAPAQPGAIPREVVASPRPGASSCVFGDSPGALRYAGMNAQTGAVVATEATIR